MNRNIVKMYPYWFLLPAALVFSIFFVLPAILGLVLSVTNATVLSPKMSYVGLDNYRQLLGDDGPAFWKSVRNQFGYAILVTLGKTLLGVAIAVLLNRKFKGRNLARAIVYMPIMFSTIVVGIVFGFILANDGLFNSFLERIGLGALTKDWFGDFDLALYSVAAVDIWMGVGWTVVLVLAALQAIPGDVLEAAALDGASAWQTFIHVKIPFIMHAIGLALLLTFITGMKAFDIVYATTGGGPGDSTELMSTFIAKALSTGSLGYPAAASTIQFLLVTVLAIIIRMFSRRLEANQA